jgi:hypothetical protein
VAHFRPLVTGDSGFVPRPYTRAMELLSESPLSDEGRRFLQAVGVRHVVSREDQPLPVAAQLGPDRVYALAPAEPVAVMVSAPGEPHPTLWSLDGITLDLGEERTVSDLSFEISDAPWVAQPRIEVSPDGQEWRAVPASASLADATLALYRDPRQGRGVVRFEPTRARFVRADGRLPARAGALRVR